MTQPTSGDYDPGLDHNSENDPEKGAILGAVGGVVTGAVAGAMTGPVGAVIGAVAGGLIGAGASGAAVTAVDDHDHDASPGEVDSTPAEVSADTYTGRTGVTALGGTDIGADLPPGIPAEGEFRSQSSLDEGSLTPTVGQTPSPGVGPEAGLPGQVEAAPTLPDQPSRGAGIGSDTSPTTIPDRTF